MEAWVFSTRAPTRPGPGGCVAEGVAQRGAGEHQVSSGYAGARLRSAGLIGGAVLGVAGWFALKSKPKAH
mgnify:CR=1 FL=1